MGSRGECRSDAVVAGDRFSSLDGNGKTEGLFEGMELMPYNIYFCFHPVQSLHHPRWYRVSSARFLRLTFSVIYLGGNDCRSNRLIGFAMGTTSGFKE